MSSPVTSSPLHSAASVHPSSCRQTLEQVKSPLERLSSQSQRLICQSLREVAQAEILFPHNTMRQVFVTIDEMLREFQGEKSEKLKEFRAVIEKVEKELTDMFGRRKIQVQDFQSDLANMLSAISIPEDNNFTDFETKETISDSLNIDYNERMRYLETISAVNHEQNQVKNDEITKNEQLIRRLIDASKPDHAIKLIDRAREKNQYMKDLFEQLEFQALLVTTNNQLALRLKDRIHQMESQGKSERAMNELEKAKLLSPNWEWQEQSLRGHGAAICALKHLSDDRLASGDFDGEIIVWNIKTGEQSFSLKGHTKSVNALEKLTGNRLVSASADKTIIVWDLAERCRKATFSGSRSHTESITAICKKDGNELVSASLDTTVRVMNQECPLILPTELKYHSDSTSRGKVHAVLYEEPYIISGDDQGTIVLKQTGIKEPHLKKGAHSGAINTIVQLSKQRFVTGSDDKTIKVWTASHPLEDPDQTLSADNEVQSLTKLTANILVSCDKVGKIAVWDTDNFKCMDTDKALDRKALFVEKLPGNRFAVALKDKNIAVCQRQWNSATINLLKTLHNLYHKNGRTDQARKLVTEIIEYYRDQKNASKEVLHSVGLYKQTRDPELLVYQRDSWEQLERYEEAISIGLLAAQVQPQETEHLIHLSRLNERRTQQAFQESLQTQAAMLQRIEALEKKLAEKSP